MKEHDALQKRNAELVRDMNALDGCWEKKLERLEARWEALRLMLEGEKNRAYCAQCSAGYKESVTQHIHLEALCKKLLLKMKELEDDA